MQRNHHRKTILFYLITLLLSWPIFFVADGWLIPKYAKTSLVMPIALYGHMLAMLAPMCAGMMVLKSHRPKRLLGWFWSKKDHYLVTFIIFFCTLYFIPASFFSFIDKDLKWRSMFNGYDYFFICSYVAFGWLAGIGEEYGWSGYLLTEWSDKIGKGRAVVVSGVLRGFLASAFARHSSDAESPCRREDRFGTLVVPVRFFPAIVRLQYFFQRPVRLCVVQDQEHPVAWMDALFVRSGQGFLFVFYPWIWEPFLVQIWMGHSVFISCVCCVSKNCQIGRAFDFFRTVLQEEIPMTRTTSTPFFL